MASTGSNLNRMLHLVGETFDVRSDPDQISVTPEESDMLARIHPATLSEFTNEDGPIAWLLMLPTATALMNEFLNGSISEKQLLYNTLPGGPYDAVYLCSATVLPEFQNQGLAKKAALQAIGEIMDTHKIGSLFYWPFSDAGRALAVSLSRETGLPLFEKMRM